MQDVSGDLRAGLGRVERPSLRSGTSRGKLQEVRDSLQTLGQVRDGSRDPPGGLGQVGGTSVSSGMDWGTLPEVRDGSRDPRPGPGRVGTSSGRSRTVRRILEETQDRSDEP